MKDFFTLISSTELLTLIEQFSPLSQETIALHTARKRILAADLFAQENLPPFSRSTMDGFAVRAKDTFGCSESETALLQVSGEIAMGCSGANTVLNPGQAVRIWTGGDLPVKADAVVMVEYTHMLDDSTVAIFRPVAPGENIIKQGEDYQSNSIVLRKDTVLRPQDLGVLSGLGIMDIPVYRQPRVAIISTGDELIAPNQPLTPGKIRDINSTTLAALVEESGCEALSFGIVGDSFEDLQSTCAKALEQADVVLLSGGSSVGKRDFTLKVFDSLPDCQVLAHGVSVRPGKPTILARQKNKALLGLPGHAGSAMVIFYLFVRPLLNILAGLGPITGLRTIKAVTGQQIPSSIGKEEYVRIRLTSPETHSLPVLFPVYGKSGLIKPLVEADGLLPIGRDVEGLDRGAEVSVLLFP